MTAAAAAHWIGLRELRYRGKTLDETLAAIANPKAAIEAGVDAVNDLAANMPRNPEPNESGPQPRRLERLRDAAPITKDRNRAINKLSGAREAL